MLQVMKEEQKVKEKKEKEEKKAKEKKEKEEQKAKEKKEKEKQMAKEKKENEEQKEIKKKKELWLKKHLKENEIWMKEREFKRKIERESSKYIDAKDADKLTKEQQLLAPEFERYLNERAFYRVRILPVREHFEWDRIHNLRFPGDRVSSILYGKYLPEFDWRLLGLWKIWDACFDLNTAEDLFIEDFYIPAEELLDEKKKKEYEEFVAHIKSLKDYTCSTAVAKYIANIEKYNPRACYGLKKKALVIPVNATPIPKNLRKLSHEDVFGPQKETFKERMRREEKEKAQVLAGFVAQVPEVPAVEPEVPAVEPEVPAVEPEVPAVEPEVPAVEPELPDMGALDVSDPCFRLLFPDYEPEVPTVEPEVPAVELEVLAVEPKVLAVEPEVPVYAPEAPNSTPEVFDSAPEVFDSALEVSDFAPAVLVFAPEVLKFSGSSGVLPDVGTVALEDPLSVPAKVVQPAISKKRNKTHQNYLARQRKKQRKAISNASASVSDPMTALD